ncbi:RES domain-containing protein [Cellulomonas sp. RIT-PI-Y]|uniref:RES domain-containing protein n=1 Tax=Cellulomonas sp. RIT-PI-Y TaxID=3035297 RepID=UPI0021D8898F|nr:RES domain-containing protein [Cellulomonas sp. RIT-PI-Y]
MGYEKRLLMEAEERGFNSLDGAICTEHITDPHLLEAIGRRVPHATCVVCERYGSEDGEQFAVGLDDLMGPVVDAIRFLFEPADTLPWDSEDHVYVGPVRDGFDVIETVCAGALEDSAFDRIIEMMAASLHGDEWTSFGAPGQTEHLEFGWERFSETAKHSSRFVYVGDPGNDRETPGTSMLAFLHQLRVYVDGSLDLVEPLPKGSMVHRGRLVEGRGEVAPTAAALGPAPEDRAAANRMSPAGISLMYASQDPQTAIAEIAAHGPKPRALVGGFRTTRPLQVLDLTKAPKVPSIFDVSSRAEYVMAQFLHDFVRTATAPIIPDGREHVDYVPTQVVTEYLRWAPETPLDGIALPSAQSENRAKTYVFFFGPADVVDAGAERQTPRSSFLNWEESDPVFTLDSDDVELWDVVRSYDAKRASRWA